MELLNYFKLEVKWSGGFGVRSRVELGLHFHFKPLIQQEIRILAQLGLGVAPRFLQKVKPPPEILTNKLGLSPRCEAAPAARRFAPTSAASAASRRGKSPNLFVKISGLGP